MKLQTDQIIIPVILSGGSGTRLWLLSRTSYLKQFRALLGNDLMLIDTMKRMSGAEYFSALIIIGCRQHQFLLAEQLCEAGFENAMIILESQARNTAPATAIAVLAALEKAETPIILLAPADHGMLDSVALSKSVQVAAKAAMAGANGLVLFGIESSNPAGGYRYTRQGDPLAEAPGAFSVDEFIEKPNVATASYLLADGCHSWNSATFLMPARILLEKMEKLAPLILVAARDPDLILLDEAASAPSNCFDYVVMGKTRIAVLVPPSFRRTDVGSWKTLGKISHKDPFGRVVMVGDIDVGAGDCYLRSEEPATSTYNHAR